MLPLFPFRKFNPSLRDRPCAILIFRVKYTCASEPILIAVIVHTIAQPRRSEHLRFLSCPLRLSLQRLLNPRTNNIGTPQQRIRIHLHLVGESFTKLLIGIRSPDDIPFCRFICKQQVQHICDRVTADIYQFFQCEAPPFRMRTN